MVRSKLASAARPKTTCGKPAGSIALVPYSSVITGEIEYRRQNVCLFHVCEVATWRLLTVAAEQRLMAEQEATPKLDV